MNCFRRNIIIIVSLRHACFSFNRNLFLAFLDNVHTMKKFSESDLFKLTLENDIHFLKELKACLVKSYILDSAISAVLKNVLNKINELGILKRKC